MVAESSISVEEGSRESKERALGEGEGNKDGEGECEKGKIVS